MPIDLFNYRRRTTTNVHVGRTPLGSNHPVRLQSMNTTSTDDVEGSIAQAGRIISAGADYVRLTTQGLREVESLGRIRDGLHAQGIRTPLVADVHFNPNDSLYAIEGITSPDGRVFGKMGHSERIGSGLYKNVPGEYNIRMFEAAVKYFR